jgi:hypothetical protein
MADISSMATGSEGVATGETYTEERQRSMEKNDEFA